MSRDPSGGDHGPTILHVFGAGGDGPMGAFFERLATGLAARGMDQRAVIRKDTARARVLGAAEIGVVEAPFSRQGDQATRRALRQEIRTAPPQIVLSWLARAAHAVPADGHVHLGVPGRDSAPDHFRNCEHLLLYDDAGAAAFKAAGFEARRLHRLPPLVDGRPAGPIARWEQRTPDDAWLIVTTGRLTRDSGLHLVLEALDRLPESFHLWIVGEGPERAALESQVRARALDNRVRFVGWRRDVPRFLAAADVYVSPSASRRLGSGIIEAWAQARPVIAISAGRSAELIDHGRTGLLVPPEGSAELAQAVAAVVENRPTALQIALAGRQAFEAGYAPAAVLEAHARLVERLAADAGTPSGSSK